MKVRDLLPLEVDVDVYDNICEELGIAFCGPLVLTPEGEKEFEDVLDFNIDYNEGSCECVVDIEGEGKNWRTNLDKAIKFFNAAAGYCSTENSNKWFKEE